MSSDLVRTAGDATLELSADDGGRVRSLRVGDLELLRTEGASVTDWGSFPMAPWAGRTRHGRFTFGGQSYALGPLEADGHAIHGTVHRRPWQAAPDGSLTTDLGEDWPFAGEARQWFELDPDRLRFRLEVHAADVAMPAACGWHPWFRRRLARGGDAVLDLRAGHMLRRDREGIASSDQVPPGRGPWDDCFGEVHWPVVVHWPGAVRLEIVSDCSNVVVYDEPVDALCVEPQTGPPDGLNGTPALVTPDRPLIARMEWRWHLE